MSSRPPAEAAPSLGHAPDLSFCVHCGTEVEPYAAGSVSPDDHFVHGVEQPPEEVYRCPRCGVHAAPFMGGTGEQCPACKAINPSHLRFCGSCGNRLH